MIYLHKSHIMLYPLWDYIVRFPALSVPKPNGVYGSFGHMKEQNYYMNAHCPNLEIHISLSKKNVQS